MPELGFELRATNQAGTPLPGGDLYSILGNVGPVAQPVLTLSIHRWCDFSVSNALNRQITREFALAQSSGTT